MNYIISFVVLFASWSSFGKTVYYGSETETVRIQKKGKTLFRFDHEVKTISQAENFTIAPADTNDVDYSLLAIHPRNSKGGNLTFILGNDAIISVNVDITTDDKSPEGTHRFFDFQAKFSHLSSEDRIEEGSDITDMDLMKAMIRGDQVVGYRSKIMNKSIRSGLSNVDVDLVQVYTGSRFNGYVFKVTNNGEDPYKLDLPKLRLGSPNLAILSHVDNKSLYIKGSSTLLRIVAKPTTSYRTITLPMASSEVQ